MARNFYARPRRQVRILEIGCGPGANIWYLACERFQTFGIDGSAVAISLARKRLSSEGLRADLRVGDISELPYRDEYFDAVVDLACLSCNPLKEAETILAEARRVLRPGGKLFSLAFTDKTFIGKAKDLGGRSYKRVKEGPLADIGFVRLTDRRTARRLYGAGFQLLSLDRLDFTVSSEAALVAHWVVVAEKELSSEK